MLKFNHVKYAYKQIRMYHNKILFQYLSNFISIIVYCSTFRKLILFKEQVCNGYFTSCVANDRNVLSLRAWPK